MPTKRKMSLLRESEREYFKGQEPMSYQSKTSNSVSSNGEVIGSISNDPINRNLKIDPLKKKDSSKEDLTK